MDQNQNGKPTAATGGTSSTPSQTNSSSSQAAGSSAFSPYLREQHAHQYLHQIQQQELHQKLQHFWADKRREVEQTADFRDHGLPLARIKKIMKADEGVKMVSAEAPLVMAKACEMFVMELTTRAWAHTEESRRRTLQKSDIAAAIAGNDVFDFLVDVAPRDDCTAGHDLYAGIQMRGGCGNGPPGVVMGVPVPDQTCYGLPAGYPFAVQMETEQESHALGSDDRANG